MSTHPSKPNTYRSFLLRLWQEGHPPAHAWRFSLEDPHSDERIGFSNLDDLVAYLKQSIQSLTKGDNVEDDKSLNK